MFEPDLLNQKRESRGQDIDLFSFLSVLPESELRRVKFFIDQRLPQDGVESMNLEIELVNQYNTVKDLQDETLADDDVPANQKAQVANSVASTLAQLIKLQEDLKRQETLKIMESTLIEVMKMQPEPIKKEFFETYEAQARKAGLIK
jgi:hypothetical protein